MKPGGLATMIKLKCIDLVHKQKNVCTNYVQGAPHLYASLPRKKEGRENGRLEGWKKERKKG